MEKEYQVPEEFFDIPDADSLEPSAADLTQIENEMDSEMIEEKPKKETVMTEESESCVHHWIVELPVDAVCSAQCKNCGAEREFRDPNTDVKWKTYNKRKYKRTRGTGKSSS